MNRAHNGIGLEVADKEVLFDMSQQEMWFL